MIDFDPNSGEVLMQPDLAMKFLVWAVYYNGLELAPDLSFSSYGRFAADDAARLDRLKDVLFKCFGSESVSRSSEQMLRAREIGEPCPFPEGALNELFGKAQG